MMYIVHKRGNRPMRLVGIVNGCIGSAEGNGSTLGGSMPPHPRGQSNGCAENFKFHNQIIEVRKRYDLDQLEVSYEILGHPFDFINNHISLSGVIGAGWIMRRDERLIDLYLLNPKWKSVEILQDVNSSFGDRYRFTVLIDSEEIQDGSVRGSIMIAVVGLLRPFCNDILRGGAEIVKESQVFVGKRWENWS